MYESIILYIRSLYPEKEEIPLHEPKFGNTEKDYVLAAIDSTFVSTVGRFVERFEEMVEDLTGANYAVATVNGTSALHIALKIADVQEHDEVITQPLNFVATVNAISYCRAHPIFIDVERKTLGLDPDALMEFLNSHCEMINSQCINLSTKRRIAACVPMHTFGHPCRIREIVELCDHYNIAVIEDAAEAFGTKYFGQYAGTFGKVGVYSFNGNKIVTSGGGGAIVTNDQKLAQHAKHLTTTAKVSHPYAFDHDEIGYNYRMPNINAALACAQLEKIDLFIEKKRKLAENYASFFRGRNECFFMEPENALSNYWLNSIIFDAPGQRDLFLEETTEAGIMTRPVWKLLNKLKMYQHCQAENIIIANWMEDRVVNLPSSVTICDQK